MGSGTSTPFLVMLPPALSSAPCSVPIANRPQSRNNWPQYCNLCIVSFLVPVDEVLDSSPSPRADGLPFRLRAVFDLPQVSFEPQGEAYGPPNDHATQKVRRRLTLSNKNPSSSLVIKSGTLASARSGT